MDRLTSYLDRIITGCLCCLIFCLPFTKAGMETFTWMALFFWLLKKLLNLHRNKPSLLLPETGLNAALGIFLLINALSLIVSVNLALSLRGFFGKQLKFAGIYFMLAEVINNKKRLSAVLLSMIAIATLITVDAAVQLVRGVDFLRGIESTRIVASFANPNSFGAWLIVFIPLLFGSALASNPLKGRLNLFLVAIAASLFVFLLLSYSRGAWLGFFIAGLFMAYYAARYASVRKRIIFLAAIAGIAVTFLILPHQLKDKVKSLGRVNIEFEETLNQRVKSLFKITAGSNMVRINLWKESLNIMKDYPFGTGINTYTAVIEKYKTFLGGGMYPHNSFLQMATEISVFGVLSFLYILFLFFRMAMQSLNRKKDFLSLSLISGLTGYLIHSFFDTHLYSLQLVVLFWFMLGFTIAMLKLPQGKAVLPDQMSI